MKITVQTVQARKALTNHYEAHQAEYQQQLAGWQEKMKEYGEQLAAWAAEGGSVGKKPEQPPKPQSFESSYKRLLKMLLLHVSDTVTLEDHEFDEVFMDRFGWRGAFAASSNMYGGSLLGSTEDYDDN